jgi:cytoplasmic iron level regulating protein YaaA (DUF328/UPF0246 family)
LAGVVNLVVLVPPSEGKAAGGRGRWRPASGTAGRRLGEARHLVIEALAKARAEGTTRHLGVRGDLLERALEATDAIIDGRARPLPAFERYTGVVWEHLGAAALDAEARRRILVPSALLGLVAADDPVPDHRLKFDVSLPGIGRLDRFWRPLVTDAVRRRPAATLVDLLPNEHRAAVDLDAIAARSRTHAVVRARFEGATGHDAKAVKGVLARHLLLHGLDVGTFSWQDWTATYDEAAGILTATRPRSRS